jgi:hypothetical protein
MTSTSIQPMNLNAEDLEAYFQKKEAEYDAMILRWHEHIAYYQKAVSANEKRAIRANKKLLAFSKSELKHIEDLKSRVRLNGGVM